MVQAVSRSPPAAALGSEFASRSLHMGFVMDETRSGYVFLWVCPVLSGLKFHSTICPYSSRLFHFISSAPVMVRQTWSASILAIHKPSIKEFITSIDPASVGHELWKKVNLCGPVVIILATGSEVRGIKPGRGRWDFSECKILSMTSFGKAVKPWVPCRRFTVRKRTTSRN